ncbi:MAG: hypothetical protein ACTHN8_03800 [Angustibacter sp.]
MSRRALQICVAVLAAALLSSCGGGGAPAPKSPAAQGSKAQHSGQWYSVEDVYALMTAYDRNPVLGELEDCGNASTWTGGPAGPGSYWTCGSPQDKTLAVRLVACRDDQKVVCGEKQLLDPASSLVDVANGDTGKPGFCYVTGHGNWAAAAGYGESEFADHPTRPACVQAKAVADAVEGWLKARPDVNVSPTGPLVTLHPSSPEEGYATVIAQRDAPYRLFVGEVRPVNADGLAITIWSSDTGRVRFCTSDEPKTPLDGRAYLDGCVNDDPFTAQAEQLAAQAPSPGSSFDGQPYLSAIRTAGDCAALTHAHEVASRLLAPRTDGTKPLLYPYFEQISRVLSEQQKSLSCRQVPDDTAPLGFRYAH